MELPSRRRGSPSLSFLMEQYKKRKRRLTRNFNQRNVKDCKGICGMARQ